MKGFRNNLVKIPIDQIVLIAAAAVECLSAEPCFAHNFGDAYPFKAFLPETDIRCLYKKQQVLILYLIQF